MGRFPVPARDDAGPTSAWHQADTVLGAAVHYDAHAPVRLSGPATDDLTGHHDRFGPRPAATGIAGGRLLDALDEIGLAGRGGGHFAASREWRTVLESGGGGGIVVANGAEGEPASAKDAALLQHRPHLVLDGLACAAEAVGASRSVVWLHAGAHTTRRAVLWALGQRRADGLREPAVEVVTGPDGRPASARPMRSRPGGTGLPAAPGRSAMRRTVDRTTPQTPPGAAAQARPGSAVRLRIDPAACDGIGMCAHLTPRLISVDSWGYPVIAGDPLTPRQARVAAAAAAQGDHRHASRPSHPAHLSRATLDAL
jgi:ferredoxin